MEKSTDYDRDADLTPLDINNTTVSGMADGDPFSQSSKMKNRSGNVSVMSKKKSKNSGINNMK